MHALVLDPPGISLREVPMPSSADECVIRVSLAGICGTDLHLLSGYAGFSGIPGHEFVGVVEAASAAAAQWVGKRVVAEINVGCGVCAWCGRGEKEHCVNRTVVGIRGRNGAFAEYLAVPAGNLHEVPSAVDDRAAVFVEPLAAACRILEQVAIESRTRAAVLGDGRLGILAAQVLRTRSNDVTLFGRHARKLDIARRVGIDARDASDAARGYDVVVDATGRQEGLTRAIDIVRPRGTVVLKSTFHGASNAALWPVAVHEVTIIGSRCGPFSAALDLIASGKVETRPLLSQQFALAEHDAAFDAARRELKVLFAVRG